MKTLIIEHAEDRAEGFVYILKKVGSSATIWRPYLEAQPNGKFDRIILTGGPLNILEICNSQNGFFQDEIKLIKSAIKNNIPILGVCLGFQLLAHLLGGKVIFQQPWLRGWLPQKITRIGLDDSLFKNVPENFSMFEYHQDQVIELPSDAVLLASSTHCPIEAFRIRNKPIWGIQFHPEISAQKAEEIFKERSEYFKADGMDVDAEIKKGFKKYNSKLVETIFSNFISISK